MAKIFLDEQFKSYLISTYPIEESLLNHLIEELGGYFSRDVKDFISLRHQELHRQGMKNCQIYEQIRLELKERRFIGPDMTIRQIRRAIYG